MEQPDLTAINLAPAIIRINHVYEVLNGKRTLSLPMFWKLHSMFSIPADSLFASDTTVISGVAVK